MKKISYTEAFTKFWDVYPKARRQAKAKCFEKWQQFELGEHAGMIAAHVEVRAKRDKQWRDGYVPLPLTFLNQRRWEDDFEEISPVANHKTSDSRPQSATEMRGLLRTEWRQQNYFRAVLNSNMVKVIYNHGGVPLPALRQMVDYRNHVAGQMEKMDMADANTMMVQVVFYMRELAAGKGA